MSRALLLLSRLYCPISQKEVSLEQMSCVAVDVRPYHRLGAGGASITADVPYRCPLKAPSLGFGHHEISSHGVEARRPPGKARDIRWPSDRSCQTEVPGQDEVHLFAGLSVDSPWPRKTRPILV
jgi:hypothetical protein